MLFVNEQNGSDRLYYKKAKAVPQHAMKAFGREDV
jgi:hypothetical protein